MPKTTKNDTVETTVELTDAQGHHVSGNLLDLAQAGLKDTIRELLDAQSEVRKLREKLEETKTKAKAYKEALDLAEIRRDSLIHDVGEGQGILFGAAGGV
jgi:hypothetical protein